MIILIMFMVLLSFVLWILVRGCWSGHHKWYVAHWHTGPEHMTCSTYHKTGPLFGEESFIDHGGIGATYRKERFCMKCDNSEYWNQIDHEWMNLSKLINWQLK